jgi:membrane glycosyltransferase
MQYRRLLRLPGLRPMGRWQLAQAILLFAGTPLYLLFLLAAAAAAATDQISPFPFSAALAVTAAWLGALYSPKLAGYAEVALSPAQRARYGGLGRFAVGVATEFAFMLLQDAVSAVAKSAAILRLGRAGWPAQNRSDRGVGWYEAARLLWPQTAIGVVVFTCFALSGWTALIWAAPLAGGLLLSIPLCVVSADPRVGNWMRRYQIAAIPEEIASAQRGREQVALSFQPQAEPD